ncbi:D-2-hydroxyacid dehydrogenase family protein [Streptomyces sp. NPDC059740]|uniref:D-2-hydroxyacid dehydrogenase family protein n=1 Tax=Streptomyces sp. NPDC059740 TaxID=3346926 RepID=UPI003655FFAD
MTYRCAVLDDFPGAATTLGDFSPLADRVDVTSFPRHFATEDELVAAVADFEIIVTFRERVAFPASVLDRLPRLRLLVATGARNTVIDYEAARRRGVTVCGTPSAGAPPVELTWALILGLARHLVTEAGALRSGGPWQSTVGWDLRGRRLGVLGLGRIGTQVAKVGLAFGMEVSAWSRSLTEERAAEVGVQRAPSLDELLATSDVLTVHLALNEGTRALVGKRELALMRPTSHLVNTARAAIVDQEALFAALHEGRIAGAALDVFDVEPLPEDHPARSAPGLLATPHLGYVSRDNLRTQLQGAVEDIEAFLAGEPLRVLGAD